MYHSKELVDTLIENLHAVVGRDNVLSAPDELLVYECDGLPQHKHRPRAVVFPASTEETAEVMQVLTRAGVPFTPRGAGTGLSGGAVALDQSVVIELARMRKILEIDERNRFAVVQTGVVNAHVSRAVASRWLHYVPDPSSQPTCTIGGNIAENAGGIHCLKYGTTTDHVLGARVVLAGGDIVDLGNGGLEQAGYDLLGMFIGSEGTFGIATEATLRLVAIPPTVRTLLADFAEVNDASHAVSAIIAAGVMPAALEMMDHEIIRAVEASVFAAGLPTDAGAALLIELDGIEAGIDEEAERVKSICLAYRARSCRLAHDENERKKLWAARKGAFGAIGRIAPDSMIQDAVVPRSRLPEVLDSAYQIASKYQLRIANVFHAGDGNLHPLICFDSRFTEEVQRVKEAGRELMSVCVQAGGSITGEHGVGLDKRDLLPLVFSDDDMDTMLRVRAAFDPLGLCNPGKIIPMLRGCGEARAIETRGWGDGGKGRQGDIHRRTGTATASEQLSEQGQTPFPTEHDVSLASPRRVSGPQPFNPDDAASQLSAIVGEENVFLSPLLPISPSSHLPISPSPCLSVSPSPRLPVSPSSLLVMPGSIAEVSEVMKLVSSEGWTVVPAGAATWLDVGNMLKRVNIVLSTERLNRIIEHEPADLVAVAESGVTLNNFNRVLSQNGQWLPLDPPDDGRATVGGVVATGLSGAQKYGYGPPRGFVIGMRVVLADGRVIKAGGRVVKNVAGYDLCKLFTGSYGTLGIIVELNFKLRPLPFETRTVLASGKLENLLAGANRAIDARLFPVAVELLSTRLAFEAELSEGTQPLLLLRFAGSRTAVSWQAKTALELLAHEEKRKPSLFASDDEELWRTLAALPLRFSNGLVWRVGIRPTDVAGFLSDVEKDVVSASPAKPMWHAGVGCGRIRVIEDMNATDDKTVARIARLQAKAQTLNSALILENANPEMKNRLAVWGKFGNTLPLQQRVKQQLDPEGILSPGRFG